MAKRPADECDGHSEHQANKILKTTAQHTDGEQVLDVATTVDVEKGKRIQIKWELEMPSEASEEVQKSDSTEEPGEERVIVQWWPATVVGTTDKVERRTRMARAQIVHRREGEQSLRSRARQRENPTPVDGRGRCIRTMRRGRRETRRELRSGCCGMMDWKRSITRVMT